MKLCLIGRVYSLISYGVAAGAAMTLAGCALGDGSAEPEGGSVDQARSHIATDCTQRYVYATQSWTGNSYTTLRYPSIAIDALDRPVVAYQKAYKNGSFF